MNYEEAKAFRETMTEWHTDASDEITLRKSDILETLEAYATEITRLAGLLADEILASEGYEIDDMEDRSLSEITHEHFMPDGRKILSVVGPHSGCGKTTFVIGLLREMSGLGCLKISPAHDWPSQQDLRATTSGDDYYLEPLGRLDHPEKDTALYAAAGAVRA